MPVAKLICSSFLFAWLVGGATLASAANIIGPGGGFQCGIDYYEVYYFEATRAGDVCTWEEAKTFAETLSRNGWRGYLATPDTIVCWQHSGFTGFLGAVGSNGVYTWKTGPMAGQLVQIDLGSQIYWAPEPPVGPCHDSEYSLDLCHGCQPPGYEFINSPMARTRVADAVGHWVCEDRYIPFYVEFTPGYAPTSPAQMSWGRVKMIYR